MTNALFTIRPYRLGTVWAFDDPGRGLQAEPLVAGMPDMINRVMALQGLEGDRVTIVFGDRPFPGALHLRKTRPEDGGAWYRLEEPFEAEGWLCPAMLRYFPEHPRDVYATISSKASGPPIDETPKPAVGVGRRSVTGRGTGAVVSGGIPSPSVVVCRDRGSQIRSGPLSGCARVASRVAVRPGGGHRYLCGLPRTEA